MPVRNPFTVVEALRNAMCHPKCKDQRVAQVISNAMAMAYPGRGDDIFYVEDDQLIDALRKYTVS